MKFSLMCLLLFCISLKAQQPPWYKEFSSKVTKCFFIMQDKDVMRVHLHKCLKNEIYPPFKVNDWNNNTITSLTTKDIQIFTFWDLEDDFEQEKLLIDSLKKKYVSIKIVAYIKNDICTITDRFSSQELNNWLVIPEFENKRIMLSQFGWPMTFILNSDGTILDFHFKGIEGCDDFSSVDRLFQKYYGER